MDYFKNNIYTLIKLATPLICTGLLQSSVYFFVTLFLAHLNEDALAAGSLVAWLFGTFNVIVVGILNSINVLVAHRYGAADKYGVSLVFRDGFWLAVVLSIPAICFFWNAAGIFALLGQTPALVKLTQSYLHALCWGLLPNFITIALMELFIGIGKTTVVLFFSALNVILNILCSYALIFGAFGLPAIGIAGAGWGTTIGFAITAVCFCIYLFTNKTYNSYTHLLLTPIKPYCTIELIRIGMPLGLMYCLEVGFFLAVILIISTFGNQLLAANQIALQYLCILMSIIFSMAQAITVRMGHLLGEDNLAMAKQVGYTGAAISVVFMFLVALLYWMVPTSLIAIDFDVTAPENKELLHYAIQFLSVCAVFQIFESARIALFGALRAIKDTRFTLYTSILSFWGIALPVGYFLAVYWDLKGVGLWWGMALSAAINAILLYWRFGYKMRKYQSYG